MRRARAIAPVVGGVAGAALLIATLPSYWVFLVTSALVGMLVALSVGIVYGRAGAVSLCQLAFAGVGAWTFAALGASLPGLPFLARIAAAGLAALPFGLLIGVPALRVRGMQLAVVTLAFAAATSIVLGNHGFPAPAASRPVFAASDRAYLVVTAGVVAVTVAGLRILDRRRSGLAWLAARHSERATAALGLSVTRTKLSAFALSALVAGLAGGLLGGQLGLLSPRSFEPVGSLTAFALAVMAGARYATGAAIAGGLGALLPEVLRRLSLPQDLALVVFAVGATHALATGGEGGVAAQVLRRRPPSERPAVAAPAMTAPSRPDHVPPPSRGGVLEVRGLSVSYGRLRALDDVDLTVPAGAVTGLVGPNGAGKSTLIDVVSGFVAGYDGTVRLDGQPIDRLPAHLRARAGIRRTFQQGRAIPELTVAEYVRLAAGRGLDDAELAALLAEFGCPAGWRRIADVDVGRRRVIELVACLAARPRLLLLDEPAAGLAAQESRALAERLAAIPERFGAAVVLVEHDLDLIAGICDTVTVLDFGQVIAAGPPVSVLEDRAVVAAYLGEEPEAAAR